MRPVSLNKRLSLTLAALMIIFAFLSNLIFPRGYSLWPLFLIAIILVSWELRWSYVYGVAAITTILALLDLFVGSPPDDFHIALVNRLSTIPAIWIVAYIMIRRRRAADEVRRQMQLINLSLDAIITRHIDGTINSWSRGAERLYGWTASEALGQRSHDLLRTEFPIAFEEILDILRREQRWEGVLIHTTRDGRRLVVQSRWMLDPGTAELLESNEDITESRRAEAEIQNLARFPGENPNPILRYSPEGKLLYANESSRTSLEVCLGDIGTVGPAEWRQWIAEVFPTGTPFETEFLCGERTFLLLFVPITAEGYVNVYGRDVTDRKRAESALVEQSERTRAIVETAVDGIITIDERGIVQTVNPSVERIFGYAPEEVLGRNVNMLMPEPYHSAHNQYLTNYLTTGKNKIIGIGREVQGKRKDGSIFPLDLAVSEIALEGRRQFTGLVHDITNRKQAENLLKEAITNLSSSNAELEQFAYVASHDLQEPLRMVASYVQLLARRYQGQLDEEADQFINFAVDGAMRMQKLIQDLLTFSRVGTRGRVFQPLDLGKILDQARENLQLAIQENDAKISFDRLPVVFGDESELVQLFQNLLDNSLKFRGVASPEIHLSAQMDNRRWLITIRDNGIGIDAKYFERIFLVFQRLHGREHYPGTGIGLAICKKIVERHGGQIWVGTQPGPGAAFHFTLPAGEQS
jgi:PAS domain S-box-containing protein